MKKLLAAGLLVAATAAVPAVAAVPVDAGRAASYQGSLMTVEGSALVKPAHAPRLGGVDVALGSGNNQSALIAYIDKGDLQKFPDLKTLNGKTVDVTGVIEMDQGQPLIRLKSPQQLTVAR